MLNIKNELIILSVVSIVIIFISINFNDNERKSYENFLLNKYKDIPSYSKEELKNIPKPEHPDLASYQNYFMTLDPALGIVPLERLKEAFNYTISLNPDNRSISWTNTMSNMGGRTRCLKYDPSDSDRKKVWAGGVTGGLWYNNDITDETSLWNNVDDLWDNLVVSSIAFDPNNPDIIYVGTGEANTAIITYRESSGRGIGLWKSVDGGINWTLLESTSNFAYITDIEINNNSDVYIGVVSGTYYGVHESLPSDGLYKSNNGGITWEQVLPNIPNDNTPYAVSDIEITSDSKIFIGTMKNINGNGGSFILHSESGDIGTWVTYSDINNIILNQEEFNIPGRVVVTSSITNPNILYAVFGSGYVNNYGFNYSYGNHIIKSENAGQSWTLTNIPNNYDNHTWATLAWHALTIEIDPIDENTLYVGGLDLHKSTNSGNSWTKLSNWALMYEGGGDQYVHADIHSITFRNNSSNEFTVTSDGGIFHTINASSENIIFSEHNNGYNTLQYYTGAIYPESNNNIFIGGLQDNGTLLYSDQNIYEFPGGALTTNNMISGGDGAYCFWDKNEPEILLTSTYYNRYYLFINGVYTNYFNGNNGIFINPADYDFNTNKLYANAVRFDGTAQNRLFVISNVDSNPTEGNINLSTNTGVPFSHIKYSHHSEDDATLFVSSQSGYLYKVEFDDDDFIVNNITGNDFPNGNISSISIGGSEDTLLVTFSNYGTPSLWLTTNGGDAWENKDGNLPDMPIRSSLFHPQSSLNALIATEIGVWGTSNILNENVSWSPYSNGLANVRVDMLNIRSSDNMVLASTHGRGQFYGIYEAVQDIYLGDINYDNELNVLDVVLLVNMILDDSFNISGDLNSDMLNNVLDVVLLVNLILNN